MRQINWTIDAEENMLLLWAGTFGNVPKIPDRDDTTFLIDKFGLDKTYEIMYKATRLGFRKMKTLLEALDDKGNIKPKENSKALGKSSTLGQGDQEYKKVLEEADKQPKWRPK